MAHDDKSKKTSSKQSGKPAGKQLSLAQLMKRSPTKVNYKNYDVKVLFIPNMKGRSGWVAMARKDNVIVIGVDSKGNICLFGKDWQAVQHICCLIDLDENNDSLNLSLSTVLEAFDD